MFSDVYLGLKFAFSYFSIFPVRFKKSDELGREEVLLWMLFFLPLVGGVIASISFLPYYFFQNILFLLVSAVLFEILTGFIHLEAVVDVVDAVFAKMGGKDAYKVIKEPTVGAIGVLWGVAFFVLKVAGYSYLLYHQRYFEIVMIAVFSRVLLLFLIWFFEFKSSFVTKLKESLSKFALVFWGLLSLKYLPFLAVGFISAWWMGKKLGFKNGDVLGASLEVVEVSMFLSLGAIVGV